MWLFFEVHLLTIVGFALGLIFLSRLMRDNAHSGSATAWLMGIIFIPYIAVPAYLFIGGRKFRKISARKAKLKFDTCSFPVELGELGPVAASLTRLSSAPPPCGGNKLEMLDTGEKGYHALLREIENARESIHICVFIFSDDPVGRAIMEALARRASEGVKVRVLVDSAGSFFTKGSYLNPIRKAGGQVAEFLPVLPIQRRWSANLRNHRKLFLFDRRVGIVGGKNIGQDYMGPPEHPARWVDFSVVARGPIVHSLSGIFAADWEFASGEPVTEHVTPCDSVKFETDGDTILQSISSGPDTPGEPLYEAILSAIFQARERVWLTTPYMVPDETILNCLCVKAKLGCDVRVIVPRKTDVRLADLARRFALRELFRAGAKVMIYQPTMIHTKLLLVDQEVAFTGSPNVDHRSLYLNYEVGLFIYSKDDVALIEEHLNVIQADCLPYTRHNMRFRGYWEELAENLSRLLSPLL